MAKVKKASLLNKSTESTNISKTLHKTKKVSKEKQNKSLLSKGMKKIRRIYTDAKTGKQYIKYEGDHKGVVYMEHIPHGFYEDQIKDFFAQFGEVTAVNLPRSKSGNGKGYAFIQFRHPDVAQVAADSMNNYLMFNRIIKTKYIPPEEQQTRLFRLAERAISTKRTPKDVARIKRKRDAKVKAKFLDVKDENRFKIRTGRKLLGFKERFEGLGLDFDCQVAGGPEALKLISVKKLSTESDEETESAEITESAEKTESPRKENEESVPAKTKKNRKRLKPGKKAVKKTVIKANEKVPAKTKTPKKTRKTPKPAKKTVQKPLFKAIEELLAPAKAETPKKTSKTPKPGKIVVQKPVKAIEQLLALAKVKTPKKTSKTPKPGKIIVQKPLLKASGEIIPSKTKTPVKKTSKTPKPDKKPVQKAIIKKSTEIVPLKMEMEMLKAVSETSKRMTRLKKSVENCLKKVDEVIPSALKKKTNQGAKCVTKKRPKKKLVTQV